jgi:hypothetical protein
MNNLNFLTRLRKRCARRRDKIKSNTSRRRIVIELLDTKSDHLIHDVGNNSTDNKILPIVLPLDLLVFRTMAVSFGVPIQLLVAFVILRNKPLHNPRNVFWLGNITCHFANHLMGAYQYLIIVIPVINRTRIFCEFHSLFVGSPYTSLLVSLLLATADRWFAISDPIKHRKYVTVSRVAGCLIIFWILVLFILTSPYWSSRVQLLTSCSALNPEVMKWVALSDFILAVLIIVIQIAVYVRTRQYLRLQSSESTLHSIRRIFRAFT